MDRDDIKRFRCPSCAQVISTQMNVCRFCSLPLTDEIKLKAIAALDNEDRDYRLSLAKKWLFAGIGVFALGVLLLGYSFFSIYFTPHGRFFIWSPILILVGLGQIIYGLLDIYSEKK